MHTAQEEGLGVCVSEKVHSAHSTEGGGDEDKKTKAFSCDIEIWNIAVNLTFELFEFILYKNRPAEDSTSRCEDTVYLLLLQYSKRHSVA